MSSKCPCLKIQLAQFSSKSLVGIFQPSFDETTELVLFDTEIRQYVSAIQVPWIYRTGPYTNISSQLTYFSPLISILSHITEIGLSTSSSSRETLSIHFLYSSRVPTLPSTSPSESSPSGSQNVDQESLNRILFLPRLRQIVQRSCPDYSLSDRQRQVPPRFRIYLNLFLTNLASFQDVAWPDMWIRSRRISEEDLVAAATDPDTVCYVCGPPPMTDNFVDVLGQIVGAERVFHERWW